MTSAPAGVAGEDPGVRVQGSFPLVWLVITVAGIALLAGLAASRFLRPETPQ
ncbi:hypothetical protein ACIQUL_32815 [Streptomyces sp. NPDC090303]|uniref:hypothetical protein n=1 Tax=Streptomyces sp. NPDC090303 TaxID=3365960 RepID=UPI003828DF9B